VGQMIKNNVTAFLIHITSCIIIFLVAMTKLERPFGSVVVNVCVSVFIVLLFWGIAFFVMEDIYKISRSMSKTLISVSSVIIIDLVLWILSFTIGKVINPQINSAFTITYLLYNTPIVAFLTPISRLYSNIMNIKPQLIIIYGLIPTIFMVLGIRMKPVRAE
jgi:hypothetical protein